MAPEAQVKSALEEITNVDGLIRQVVSHEASTFYVTRIEIFLTNLSFVPSSHHGLQLEEEDGKKGILLSIWESPEKLKAFRDTSGSKFNSLIAGLSTGKIQRYEYLSVQRSPQLTFGANLTELAWGKAKDSSSAAAFKDAVIRVSDLTSASGYPSAVGEGADGTILVAAGWENIDEHIAFSKTEGASVILREIMGYADVTIIHVSLKKRGV
ncbi:hypothetical protein D9757_008339 [Collybiopsis confluens]|uniref:Uncharacterized protein n=1 Tax=Collybiopsis confluens TaxID=2823264 RepID=A0A8H5M5Q3_9AGAR|nr:hypothetical protein D9757_008339 [Collybiopsis confluens]